MTSATVVRRINKAAKRGEAQPKLLSRCGTHGGRDYELNFTVLSNLP